MVNVTIENKMQKSLLVPKTYKFNITKTLKSPNLDTSFKIKADVCILGFWTK